MELAWMLLLQSCWLCLVTSTSWISSTPYTNNFTDQTALLIFKSHVTWDPNNTLSDNWTTTTSFCNWIGISCSLGNHQRVTKLDLHDMGLEGTIPPQIANLSFLVHLNLSHNNFHGHIPQELGSSSKLTIVNLGNNRFSGAIPDTLDHLLHLEILNLENNNLTDPIPSSIFNISSLVDLRLSSNSLSGQLPTDFFLPSLEILNLYNNQISGSIPFSLSNSSKLTELRLGQNKHTGSIPYTLGNLLYLEILNLQLNNLTGTIPSNIFNLSSLTTLGLGFNQLSGYLPLNIGNWLLNIRGIYLTDNLISGHIPFSLGNASKLTNLEIPGNAFSGLIPTTLGNLQVLRRLTLSDNRLMIEPGTKELNFLTYLTSCSLLEVLDISSNPLQGIFPSSIGNFSILQSFYASRCQIEGAIPMEFGNLSSLMTLSLHHNNLRGTIPSTIGRLERLQGLDLSVNMLQGSIPIEFRNLRYLALLILHLNILSGGIPDFFQDVSRLQIISLHKNKLVRIPSSLWTLQDLRILYLSHNSLGGVLPQEVGNLKQLVELFLSVNQFEGSIPNHMGHLQMLQYLDLSSNSLEGPIPQSFGELISIEVMDLSFNTLNGSIPKSLEMLRYLEFLNLSFNRLEGEIPDGGVFANLTSESFIGNYKLCSAPKLHIKLNVSICSTNTTKSRVGLLPKKVIISTVVVTTLVLCISLLIIIYHVKMKKSPSLNENLPKMTHEMISYQKLLQATNNFSETNLIGVGSFGSVYKGRMVDGSLVAVKVLNIELEEAWRSFDAECQVMQNVRHRNLVKIITSCSNLDFRALVLQFMPNGNLDQWLYSQSSYLCFLQRIGIMIDVALAMEHLHHYHSGPVVHCDLKPCNVLLDDYMVAHVSDFGIAKLLDENKSATQTNTLGTIGYVAPEYGLEGRVSTKGDVYSYGILLLEMLTRKKPTDSMFIGGLSLRQWVNTTFPDAIMDVVDINLLREIDSSGNNIKKVDDPRGRRIHCLLSIVEVGLLCSREVADERIDMKDVVVRLMKIKKEFLSI